MKGRLIDNIVAVIRSCEENESELPSYQEMASILGTGMDDVIDCCHSNVKNRDIAWYCEELLEKKLQKSLEEDTTKKNKKKETADKIKKIKEIIDECELEHKRRPTLKEMAYIVGESTSMVMIHMRNMGYDTSRQKKSKEEIREKAEAYRKEYYERNKEAIAERKREYNEKNKEKMAAKKKEYYERNKEAIQEKHREYYEKNKEKIAAQQKEYREKNKEKLAAQQKEYYEKHKEEKLAAKRKENREKNREALA